MKINDISNAIDKFLEDKREGKSSVLSLEFERGGVIVFNDLAVSEIKYNCLGKYCLPSLIGSDKVILRDGIMGCEFEAKELINIEVIEVSK